MDFEMLQAIWETRIRYNSGYKTNCDNPQVGSVAETAIIHGVDLLIRDLYTVNHNLSCVYTKLMETKAVFLYHMN